jgi:hypothetical protein
MLEEETGIDNNEQIQFIAGKGSGVGLPDFYGIFKVKDHEKFNIMLKKELNADIKEKKGINYFSKSKDNYVMVWNDEFAIAGSVPINFSSLFGGGDESSKTVNKCINLLKEASSSKVDSKYVDFLKKDADVATYFETKGLVDYLSNSKVLDKDDIVAYKESYEGNTFESYLNFDKGVVKWEHKMFLSDVLLEKVDFIPENGIGNALLSFGKSENPMFKYSFHLNPVALMGCLKDQMKEDQFTEFEIELASKGFTTDDITNTFTGEVLVIIDGMVTATETIDYGYGEAFEITNNEPIVGIALSLKDKAVFTNITESMEQSSDGIIDLKEGFFGYLSGDVFFASNDTAWINQVVNNKSKELKDEEGKLKEQPFGFYAGIDNPSNKKIYSKEFPIAEILENIWGYANLSEAEVNVILKNKSENSLRVITQYISDYLVEEENQVNEDFKNILDKEVVENLEQGIKEVENALKDIDVEEVVSEIFKEKGK